MEAFVGADITSFRRGMAEVRSTITATTGLSAGLMNLGSALTLAVSAPIAAIGALGVKSFSDFETAMRNANSVAQLSEEQFASVSEEVRKLGSNAWEGATGAANALNTVFQAGFGLNDVNEALAVTDVSIRTAEAGMADTVITTQALVAALLSYSQGADMAQHYSDVLTRTVQVGVGSMNAFASGIGAVLPQAAALGVSFDEVGANLAFLTQRGLSPDEASTALGGLLRKLMNPTEAMSAALAQLGVSSGKELITKFGGLEGALMELGKGFDYNADAMFDLFNEVRAFRGLASIFNNVDAWTDTLVDFGQATEGATAGALEQQSKSLESELKRTWSAITASLIPIGEKLADALRPMLGAVKEFFNTLGNVDSATVENIIKIGIALAAIPVAIWAIGAAMTPLGGLIAALGLLKLAYDNNFLGIKNVVDNVLLPALQVAIPRIIGLMGDLAFFAEYHARKFFSTIDQYFHTDVENLLTNVITGDWENVKNNLSQIWVDIQNLFWEKLARPLGEALAGLGATNFSGIALGISAIGAAMLVMGGALVLFKLPVIITALTTALVALLGTALFPIAIAIAIGAGLVLAYTNNWGGFKDFVDTQLRPVLEWLWDIIQKISDAMSGDWLTNLANELGALSTSATMDVQNSGMGAGGQGGLAAATILRQIMQNSGLIPQDTFNTPDLNPMQPFSKNAPRIDVSSFNRAAGYGGSSGTQNNDIKIYTNNAGKLLTDLRSQGIDLKKARKG